MTDATSVMTWYHKNWPIQTRKYEVGNTSEVIRLHIPGIDEESESQWDRVRCNIRRLIVSCDSTSFDVHVFEKATGVIDGEGQIYRSVGNNKWVFGPENLPFVNKDDGEQDPFIYLKVVGGSGTIVVDIMVT